jgi:hypothetical protein
MRHNANRRTNGMVLLLLTIAGRSTALLVSGRQWFQPPMLVLLSFFTTVQQSGDKVFFTHLITRRSYYLFACHASAP